LEDAHLRDAVRLEVDGLSVQQGQIVGEAAGVLDRNPLAGSDQGPGSFDGERGMDVPAARLAPGQGQLEVVGVALLDEDRVGRGHAVYLAVLHQHDRTWRRDIDEAGRRLAKGPGPGVQQRCPASDGEIFALLDGVLVEDDVGERDRLHAQEAFLRVFTVGRGNHRGANQRNDTQEQRDQ